MFKFRPTAIQYLPDILPEPTAAKVLIADDEPDIQLITRMSLRRLQWQGNPLDIHRVSSGAAAVEFIKKNPDTHVVILDIMMEHDRAGLDSALAIHALNPRTEIIIQTGQASILSEHEVILNYPVSHYLPKGTESAQRICNMVLLSLKNHARHGAVYQAKQAWEAFYTYSNTLCFHHAPEALLHWLHHDIIQGPCALVSEALVSEAQLTETSAPRWWAAASPAWIENHCQTEGKSLRFCRFKSDSGLFYEADAATGNILHHLLSA